MRKRNWSVFFIIHSIRGKLTVLCSLVFRLVEAEEEYVEQLEVLSSCFIRPFKMAASAKNPPTSHEDLSSIFLNCETVLFLHQIFLKGLAARMSCWPTLGLGNSLGQVVNRKIQHIKSGYLSLGDLFDMLLPMLSIYQEYVRKAIKSRD